MYLLNGINGLPHTIDQQTIDDEHLSKSSIAWAVSVDPDCAAAAGGIIFGS